MTENLDTEVVSQLVAGDVHELKPVTLAAGQAALARGAVLGMISESELKINHGTVSDGPFQAAETVTGGTSGATGVVVQVNSGSIEVKTVTGTFAAEETITGGTSSASAEITTTVDERYKCKELAPSAVNGLATPRAILAEDADASSEDAEAQAYVLGKFRSADLGWPTGITAAQKQAAYMAMQDRGISVDTEWS